MAQTLHFLSRSITFAAATTVLCGCASLVPWTLPPGTPIDQVRAATFAPTGEYRLPNGGTRLEFAQGSFGKEKYMVDFDSKGLLVSSTQVLTGENLARITPGTSQADVLMQIGRPVHVINVQRQKLHVWNYRFAGVDCVWFQVSISDETLRVIEASESSDPACDGPSRRF